VIDLTETRDGLLLPVKARPGAKKNALLGEQSGSLKISVVAAPEQGKANEAIVKLLAEKLQLRRSDVELSRGRSASIKSFLIRGLTRNQLAERLADLLENESDVK
jgi:uncharacterized protein (TIGR00251 family)